jgi:hypothetical protein
MLQAAAAGFGEFVRTAWRSQLPAGRYRLHLLTNRVPVKAARHRADFVVAARGEPVGRVEVADEHLADESSEWNVHPGWLDAGTASLSPGDEISVTWERRAGSAGGFGAWDAIALERVDEGPKP